MKNSFIIIILSIILSSCGDRCIEADDFGHAAFYTSARYTQEEMQGQEEDRQVAPWRKTPYTLNGKPLTVAVRGWDNGVEGNTVAELSAWCPWFGTSNDEFTLVNLCTRFKECEFENDEMCTDTPDANLTNAPCIFKKGVGLYALLAEPNTDPNLSTETRKKPQGITFHVGAKRDGYDMYEVDRDGNDRLAGGRVYNFITDDDRERFTNSEVYFKILDKFYDDNSGKYKIVIKSGVRRIGEDPFVLITDLIHEYIFGNGDDDPGVVSRIYLSIINNPGYQTAVSALLILFVIYTGMLYLMGHVDLTKTELIIRVLKIGLVSALLNTETSWTFFNDYLFVYFIGGIQQILGILFDLGATGPG
ncbi:MAG: hypothetical protein DGJ47_000980, partial [Rickettsiaceae bacterium]